MGKNRIGNCQDFILSECLLISRLQSLYFKYILNFDVLTVLNDSVNLNNGSCAGSLGWGSRYPPEYPGQL